MQFLFVSMQLLFLCFLAMKTRRYFDILICCVARTPFAIEIDIFSRTKEDMFLYLFNVY